MIKNSKNFLTSARESYQCPAAHEKNAILFAVHTDLAGREQFFPFFQVPSFFNAHRTPHPTTAKNRLDTIRNRCAKHECSGRQREKEGESPDLAALHR